MHLFWVRRQAHSDKMLDARKEIQMREKEVLHQFWVLRQAVEDNGSEKMDVALSPTYLPYLLKRSQSLPLLVFQTVLKRFTNGKVFTLCTLDSFFML